MDSDSSHPTEVTVESDAWRSAVTDPDPFCRRVVAAVLDREAPHLVGRAEVSVVLTDDTRIRELNRIWRSKDEATNVLSFPAHAPGDPWPEDGPLLLGDVVVAHGITAAEAAAAGKTLADHLAHLLVHGSLHLLGHDHEGEREALRMERLEADILADLGVADPYPAGAA